MDYCRFENTLKNLEDCHKHMFDTLSDSEARAQARLVEVCRAIVEEWDLAIGEDDAEEEE